MSAIHQLLQTLGRSQKPRDNGLTLLLDTGIGVHAIEDLAAVSCAHADFAKIVWGSALITNNLEDKLAAYRKANIATMFGGIQRALGQDLSSKCLQRPHQGLA